MKLFTYGTLMFPEVWERISIGPFPSRPATLRGYSIFRVRDALYPGILRSKNGAVVNGLLYEEIDEDTLFELDTYESSFYVREPVVVQVADGSEVECHAYVVPESRSDMLTEEPWHAQWFQEHKLGEYLNG